VKFDLSSAYPILKWQFGLFYWINFVYSYLTVGLGMVVMVRTALHRMRFFAVQNMLLILGALIPIVVHIVYIVGLSPTRDFDLTPFTFLITGLLWTLAIFRYQFLDLVPFARAQVFERMPLGVIVLDAHDRIVDINLTAENMLEIDPDRAVGQPVSTWMQSLAINFMERLSEKEIHIEQEIKFTDRTIFLELQSTPLKDVAGNATGSMLLLQDISRRKQAEHAEREQRLLAEVLRDMAYGLNQTQVLEEILDHLLTNFYKITAFDAAQIIILPSAGQKIPLRRIRRSAANLLKDSFPTPDIFDYEAVVPEAFLNMVREHQSPFIRSTATTCVECPGYPERDWIRSTLGVPIWAQGHLIGIGLLESKTEGFFSAELAEQLKPFADQAAVAIEKAHLYAELQKRALYDELTGVYNRRGALDLAEGELARCHRFLHPMGVLMFDLDNFKTLNDSNGHLVGDRVLCEVVKICLSQLRQVDILGRYGGDEFVVMLPECGLPAACRIAERLREKVAGQEYWNGDQRLAVTISVGASADMNGSLSLDELLQIADQALYAAKVSGRNRVRY
jgi:diguanylate cyclase (GGDEF)-like protein/PAS domain S-box-containing protein